MAENPISPPARRLRRPGLPVMLAPLAIRDYALLFVGMTVSLIGDGIYLVAIAWQVYELSNAPTALSIVGVAWTLPLVLFVLLGGVVSDRVDRRKVMIAADLIRFVGIAALGALSIAGALELWHVIALVAIYGAGEAFFGPAFGAIVPDIVPRDQLVQANSLNQLMRPLAHRLTGPALGGAMIAVLGAGGAFLVDAGTFIVSAAALALMQPRPPQRDGDESRSVLRDIHEGWRFVRARTWLWGTLIAASITLLVFWGPHEVLIPYIVKNDLGGGAAALGFVFAAGGVGSVLAAIAIGQRGLPRRHITFMYLTWTLGGLAIAGYGLVVGRLAGDGRQLRRRRARHSRSDRVGDDDPPARAGAAARTGRELRLARLDSARTCVVRGYRADRGRARRPGDADRRRPARSARDDRVPVPSRHARHRAGGLVDGSES